MDIIDIANEYQQRFNQQALDKQQAKPRYQALWVDNCAYCPDCQEPLAPHRVQAGICVDCLNEREYIAKRDGQHG